MDEVNILPWTVVQKLEEAGIPQDSLIFYQKDRWVYQIGQSTPSFDLSNHQPIDSLGPFDIHSVDVSFILFPESKYTITKIGARNLTDGDQVTGIYAPIAQITLDRFARSVASIPDDATHFCWLYPPNGGVVHNNIDLDNSHEENLLKIGGFAYFNVDPIQNNTIRLVRVNSLIVSATDGLNFKGPYRWKKEYTKNLWDQNRFQPVTLPYLIEKGTRYFAFINPYEALFDENNQRAWKPSPHGAFVYLFNEDHSPHPYDCSFSVSDDRLGVAPSDEQEFDILIS